MINQVICVGDTELYRLIHVSQDSKSSTIHHMIQVVSNCAIWITILKILTTMLKKFVGMVFKLLSVCLWASQSHLKHRTRDTTYTHTHTHIQSAWQKCKLIIKIYIKTNKGCTRNIPKKREASKLEKKNKTK